MRTLAQKPTATQQARWSDSGSAATSLSIRRAQPNSVLQLQQTFGNRAVQRMLHTRSEEPGVLAPLRAGSSGWVIQRQLAVHGHGDPYEQEADRVSEQMLRTDARESKRDAAPSIQRLTGAAGQTLTARNVQRLCSECEKEGLQQQASPEAGEGHLQRQVESRVDAVKGGQALTGEQRSFFEPRFGADFGHVRIHTDSTADSAARGLGALAYTRGSDIVFRSGQYNPSTHAGRKLLAHELTHVVQQGAAPAWEGSRNQRGAAIATGTTIQRAPGDGMLPPGDCTWGIYTPLRAAVETAKVVVNSMGACAPGDSCIFLATKIAAIGAEIAARVALDYTCFRGGDRGHQTQVQDRINMLNRCYQFFARSNCPQELLERARAIVEQAAQVVAAAFLIAAFIVLVILLAKAIIAAGAALAAGAAATATLALLLLLLRNVSPGGSEPPAA